MALFQFRKGRDEQAAPPKPAQSVEAMRRRAMHRLIGAAILVVAGVIGFPMLFDNQPRPISVDLPILIPEKSKVAALAVPPALAKPAASAAIAAPVVTTPAAAAAPAGPPPAPVPASVVVVAVPPAKPAVTATPSETAPASAAPVAKAGDAGKALALLEGKDAAGGNGAEDGARFVVQVGAFADATKAREVRLKVESAGLKTYTQVVETKEGSRTRVRVGPFGDKAEANRAADKIRKLDLPVAILVL
ncbi:MAG: SPOR domain-containing protein [Burkholderiaceae bacterium]